MSSLCEVAMHKNPEQAGLDLKDWHEVDIVLVRDLCGERLGDQLRPTAGLDLGCQLGP